jgi:predicted ferric reductase
MLLYKYMIQVKQNIWQVLLWLNVFIIFLFWFDGSGNLLGTSLPQTALSLGRLSGLLAVYTVLLQFFFMGRLPMLEKAFGLDRLSRIHHTNGKLSFYFILLHPLLIIYSYKSIVGISVWEQIKVFLLHTEDVVLALIGLILFMIVIATSIKLARSRMRYEYWYFVHLIAYIAIFVALPHQLELGEDLNGKNLFYFYWIGLYAAVFASHLIFRFIRPIYIYKKQKFKISRIVRENYNTVSVYIKGNDLTSFDVNAGQFMIVRFLIKGMWWQAHPFSISHLPQNNEIRITPKELGDFTGKIKDLAPDTKVLIEGPYGAFTSMFGTSNKVLFIAGGIGITPIRTLMEDMLQKGKDVILLYGNKSKEDIVFKNELEEVAQKYPAKISYVLSEETDFPGERGYIDEEKIKRLVPDFINRDIYLCGPPPMMDKLITVFKNFGVRDSQLHFEKFSLG